MSCIWSVKRQKVTQTIASKQFTKMPLWMGYPSSHLRPATKTLKNGGFSLICVA